MFGGKFYRLGSLFGIPVGFSLSFFLFFGFIAIISPAFIPLYILLFLSVTVHEFGHALAARKFGFNCDRIVLHVFGGAAMLDLDYSHTLDKKRWFKEELLIAGAGPATSLALAALGLLLWVAGAVYRPVAIFFYANLLIGVFNLLPVFPMDGGRILRAVLTRFTNFRTATVASRWVARFVLTATFALALSYEYWIYLVLCGFILLLGEREASTGIYRYDVLTGRVDDIY